MRKILIVFLFVSLCISCSDLRNVRVTGCRVAELDVSGLSSLSVLLEVSVDNPGRAFVLEDFTGVLRRRGKDFAEFSLGSPVTVPERMSSECEVRAGAVLCGNVSPFGLLSLTGASAEDFTVDASVVVRPDRGIRKKLRLRDVPLEQFLGIIGK